MSPQTVSIHRRKLVEEGRLSTEAAASDRTHRAQAMLRLPLLAGVPAQPPSLPLGDGLDLVQFLTGGDRTCFAAFVDDDAMERAPYLLRQGSAVIVRPQRSADDNDVVLARVLEGSPRTVIRRLVRDADGSLLLRASDPEVVELRGHEVEVIGIVISMVRRLVR